MVNLRIECQHAHTHAHHTHTHTERRKKLYESVLNEGMGKMLSGATVDLSMNYHKHQTEAGCCNVNGMHSELG